MVPEDSAPSAASSMGCVALDKSLHLSGPLFSIGTETSCFLSFWWNNYGRKN